jgi:hypothetical protein
MHVTAFKSIGRYLLKASGKCIILSPSSEIAIDCYVDADFTGLWNWEDHDDEKFVKSRTGYVYLHRCFGNFKVLWITCLQGGIAMRKIKTEYIALSMSIRDLLPFKRLV